VIITEYYAVIPVSSPVCDVALTEVTQHVQVILKVTA
jgi:hypothetical protein